MKEPYYEDENLGITLLNGDCLEMMKEIPDDSIHSVVTDPPYGINFMAKKWDYDVPVKAVWEECLRVLKPGGHVLAFAGTRTQHRMAINIEDAGFQIRDMLAWIYGEGFPKSTDIGKRIDIEAGATREVIGHKAAGLHAGRKDANGRVTVGSFTARPENAPDPETGLVPVSAPATEEAKIWDGWGTAIKPCMEPITMARKSFEGTVAQNVLKHGTGGLNLRECRIPAEDQDKLTDARKQWVGPRTSKKVFNACDVVLADLTPGRFPANLMHDGSDEVIDIFPTDANGSVARFFYCPKADALEKGAANNHPTVKPLELMRYLIKLVTPKDGVVLDPFSGSGTTLVAARLLGRRAVGVELQEEYCEIIKTRLQRGVVRSKRPDKTTQAAKGGFF